MRYETQERMHLFQRYAACACRGARGRLGWRGGSEGQGIWKHKDARPH